MTRRCSICRQPLADSPIAAPSHGRKHRNDFRDLVGRPPEDYDEVRRLFNEGVVPDDVDLDGVEMTTLADFAGGGDE